MSDPSTSNPDIANSDPEKDSEVTHLSGSVNIDANSTQIGQDVVGHDKVVSANTYIERVEVHYHSEHRQVDDAQMVLPSGQPANFFISYKRHAFPDQQLADTLYEYLTSHGHKVFIDTTMRTGDAWLEEIDRQLKTSDFLIVLLSEQSADSEMVRAEVSRAYEYRQRQGHPHTLPVRVSYGGLLPYSIDAFLNPLQYVVWQSEADTVRVCEEIGQAIAGQLPDQAPVQAKLATNRLVASGDGHIFAGSAIPHPPLPEFDPRVLNELEVPGGSVKLSDKFYIERESDARLREQLAKRGTTTTIRAPRQTGKTSMLMREIYYARKQGNKVVFCDVQSIGHEQLTSFDLFLRALAEAICDELGLDDMLLDQAWQGTRSASVKLQRFLEKRILQGLDKPMILAMDEVDNLLQTDFSTDFFGLLRSWHNRRATNSEWEKFNLALVISTEPYLLIADVNQSPFNVGLNLGLSDFTAEQVSDLNVRHGSPVAASDMPYLMNLLQGHPYLTRQALYALATSSNWPQFMHEASTDQGPFGDHLRRQYWVIQDKPELKQALREIINTCRCSNDMALFRLLRAGLVRGNGSAYACRCGLYELYFKDKLR
jgi:hypothetical protein